MLKSLTLLTFLFLVAGCVPHIPFEEQVPSVEYKNNDRLVVSVIDDRQRVKDGKPRNFIGIAHGTFGIPFDWDIAKVLSVEAGDKDRDLSQWLQYRVVKGLESRGWDVVDIDLEKNPKIDQVENLMIDNNCSKMLIFQIIEWYFSMNLNWVTAFNFDTNTNIIVYEIKNGKILSKNFSGRDVIDEKANESPQNNILRAYREQLIEILSDPEVKNSLTGTGFQEPSTAANPF